MHIQNYSKILETCKYLRTKEQRGWEGTPGTCILSGIWRVK